MLAHILLKQASIWADSRIKKSSESKDNQPLKPFTGTNLSNLVLFYLFNAQTQLFLLTCLEHWNLYSAIAASKQISGTWLMVKIDNSHKKQWKKMTSSVLIFVLSLVKLSKSSNSYLACVKLKLTSTKQTDYMHVFEGFFQ